MNRFLLSSATAVMAAMLASAAAAQTFNNGSFESADFTGWTQGGGTWFGGLYPVPGNYLPGGPNFTPGSEINAITSAGFDPRTDGVLRTVYAGNHSAQVNDSRNNYSVSVLSQRVNGYTDPLIAFAYAAVLQESHGTTDSSAFIITLTDLTTNEVLFNFNLNSATAPGVFTQSSQGWFYSDWIEQSIDVSTRIGHDFLLSLLANDCPYGGHAGYAYLDGFGGVLGGGGTGGGGAAQRWFWDGDGATSADNGIVDGGDGVWTAIKPNFTVADGSANGAYSPQPGNVVFTGTAGTVTVDATDGDIAVTGMTFLTDGYVVTGDGIELSGAVATIQVGDGTPEDSAVVAVIESELTGTAALDKTGFGTLVLDAGNSYEGGTTVSEGTLVGSSLSFGSGAIDNEATLIFDQAVDGTFGNGINGTGILVKRGNGTLTITGSNGLTGPTTVAAGRLLVNGDMSTLLPDGQIEGSFVTVNSGATLGGTGSVGGVSVLSGGTIAPGNSIGRLTANGTYNQASGSIYQVELTSTGQNDYINTAGPATLAAGAVANVTKLDAAPYVLGTRYTILTSTISRTGTFTVTGNTRVSSFINVIGTYDARNAYLSVLQTRAFTAAGATPNQIAAAGGADNSGNGPLYRSLAYLPTDVAAQDAFDQVSGEIHASLRGATFEDSRFVREAVVNHLVSQTEARQGLWLHGYGSWGTFEGDGNAAEMRRDIGGLFLGFDILKSASVSLGALVGYSTADISVRDRNSTASTDDIHVGAYGDFKAGGFGARIGVAYVWRDVQTRRSVNFAGFNDSLAADYDVKTFQVFGDVGYRFDFGNFGIEPFAALAYVNVDSQDFRENGGTAQLIGVDNVSSDFWTSTLGGRVSYGLPIGNGSFGLTAMAGWRHSDGDALTTPVVLRLQAGGPFEIAGVPISEDVASLGLKFTGKLDSRSDFDIGYNGQIGNRTSDHGVKASLRLRF